MRKFRLKSIIFTFTSPQESVNFVGKRYELFVVMAKNFEKEENQIDAAESDQGGSAVILLVVIAFAFGFFCGSRWYANSFAYQTLNSLTRVLPGKKGISLSFP